MEILNSGWKFCFQARSIAITRHHQRSIQEKVDWRDDSNRNKFRKEDHFFHHAWMSWRVEHSPRVRQVHSPKFRLFDISARSNQSRSLLWTTVRARFSQGLELHRAPQPRKSVYEQSTGYNTPHHGVHTRWCYVKTWSRFPVDGPFLFPNVSSLPDLSSGKWKTVERTIPIKYFFFTFNLHLLCIDCAHMTC